MDKLATEEYPEISYHLNEIAQAVHTGSFLPSNKNGHSWVMEVEGYDNQVFMFDQTNVKGCQQIRGVYPLFGPER